MSLLEGQKIVLFLCPTHFQQGLTWTPPSPLTKKERKAQRQRGAKKKTRRRSGKHDGTRPKSLAREIARHQAHDKRWHRDYDAYLQGEHWQEFKQAWWATHPAAQCFVCGADEPDTLHHMHYRSLGRESAEDVRAVHPRCHQKIHAIQKHEHLKIAAATLAARERFGRPPSQGRTRA